MFSTHDVSEVSGLPYHVLMSWVSKGCFQPARRGRKGGGGVQHQFSPQQAVGLTLLACLRGDGTYISRHLVQRVMLVYEGIADEMLRDWICSDPDTCGDEGPPRWISDYGLGLTASMQSDWRARLSRTLAAIRVKTAGQQMARRRASVDGPRVAEREARPIPRNPGYTA